MHSKTGNIQQLRHDLRNGPSHVFGDHCECTPAFCKLRLNSGRGSDYSSSSSDSDSDSDNGEDRQDDQTLTAQFEDIMQADLTMNQRQLTNMIYILDLQHCTVYLTDFWRRLRLVVIAWCC